MSADSQVFSYFTSAASSSYNDVTFTSTSVVTDDGTNFISDFSPSSNINVGDPVTFYYNIEQSGSIPGTYLGYYLDGLTQHPLVEAFGTDYLLGETTATTYPIIQAAYIQAACYVEGTLIRTARGDIAVEHLAIGDHVVTVSGAHRPIRWLGHRRIDCRLARDRKAVSPVCIRAGAFGPGKPDRNLYVSPGHAICVTVVEEVLIPADALINGSTVVPIDVDSVTYWHVELDGHDVLLANGLPSESFIDVGNRGFFVEGDMTTLHLGPDSATKTLADYCRPFVSRGPLVEAARDRMRHLAMGCGWSIGGPDLGGVHLVADGTRIEPEARGLSLRFLVPADVRDVRLLSDVSVPRDLGLCSDTRGLGVCIAALEINDGLDVRRAVDLDDPRLAEGFHQVEEGRRRWTNGQAKLPAIFWEGCQGAFFLRVDLAMPSPARWIGPAMASTNEMVRDAA